MLHALALFGSSVRYFCVRSPRRKIFPSFTSGLSFVGLKKGLIIPQIHTFPFNDRHIDILFIPKALFNVLLISSTIYKTIMTQKMRLFPRFGFLFLILLQLFCLTNAEERRLPSSDSVRTECLATSPDMNSFRCIESRSIR